MLNTPMMQRGAALARSAVVNSGRAIASFGSRAVSGIASFGRAAAGVVTTGVAAGGAAAAGAAAVAGTAGLAGLAIAVGATVAGLKALDSALEGATESAAQFSPEVAQAQSVREIARMEVQMDRAEQLGPQLASFSRSQTRMEVAMGRAMTDIYELLLQIWEDVGPYVESFFVEFVPLMIKYIETIVDGVALLVAKVLGTEEDVEKWHKRFQEDQRELFIMSQTEEDIKLQHGKHFAAFFGGKTPEPEGIAGADGGREAVNMGPGSGIRGLNILGLGLQALMPGIAPFM